jgi:asparagine synthase (glutamine-hydrolysing)
MNIDDPVLVNDGLVLYSGSAHLLEVLRLLEHSNLGLLHTGMIGDGIFGTFLEAPHHSRETKSYAATSSTLFQRIEKDASDTLNLFANSEIFKFYSRGFTGAFNGFWVAQQFSEFASPFLYVDFLDYAMRIPPPKRYKSKIYKEWILRLAPEAAIYPWEKIGYPITKSEYYGFLYKYYKAIKKRLFRLTGKLSMNPFDYWYRTNEKLRSTLDGYFNDHIALLGKYPDLRTDAEKLFRTGNAQEKTLSLTLLAAMKLLGL